MFNGNPVKRINDRATCQFQKFIEPIFYKSEYPSRQVDWGLCLRHNLNAVPCHRQNGFDFSKEFRQPVKVISISLDWIDFLGDRFKKIHLDGRNKRILNSHLDKILELFPNKYKEIINADYKTWASNNCLESDIEFKFSWIFDLEKVEKFCLEHKLEFNQDWIMDIRKNLQQYVVL